MKIITIIEDDIALNNGIALALKNADYSFRQLYKLSDFKSDEPTDLIILDINLPDGNGFDFLRKLRQISDTPVIILTANDLETDEVTGLELGADDYITKPFSLMVLRARIDKVLKKANSSANNVYTDDTYYFDFNGSCYACVEDLYCTFTITNSNGTYTLDFNDDNWFCFGLIFYETQNSDTIELTLVD